MTEMSTETDDTEIQTDGNSEFPVSYDRESVKERFRSAIRTAGGNQAVAVKSGIPRGTINSLLAGNDPSLGRAYAIAAACGVSLDWLATGNGPEQSGAPSPSQTRPAQPPPDASDGTGTAPAYVSVSISPRDSHKTLYNQGVSSDGATLLAERDSPSPATPGNVAPEVNNPPLADKIGVDPLYIPQPLVVEKLEEAIEIIRILDGDHVFVTGGREVAERIAKAYAHLVGKKP